MRLLYFDNPQNGYFGSISDIKSSNTYREQYTKGDIPSFKVAVSLTPLEALGLASELLQAASSQLEKRETKPGKLFDSGS